MFDQRVVCTIGPASQRIILQIVGFLVAGSRSIDFDFLLSYFFLYGASLVSMHSIKSKMLFGLDYRQTKVTDSTLQNTLAILKNKRIPLDPRATSSDTLALLTNFITTLQIYAWEIPRKVVFLEIFFHWFKCTNYSLYDMIFFPKLQLEIPFIFCTWDSN